MTTCKGSRTWPLSRPAPIGGRAGIPAASGVDRRPRAKDQRHGLGAALLLQCYARSARACQAPLVHARAAQGSGCPKPGRGCALSRGGAERQVQGSAQRRLRCGAARRRGRRAEGVRHRFRTHDAARRAGQRPQGSPRDAFSGATRTAARLASHWPPARLAVSGTEAGQPDDDTPAHARLPRGGPNGRDYQAGDAAHLAPQLRDPPARTEHRRFTPVSPPTPSARS